MISRTAGLEVDWDGGETSVLDLHLGVNCPEGAGAVRQDLHHFVTTAAIFNLDLGNVNCEKV